MLGKLIKHEFKGSAHYMGMAYASLGITCVLIFLMWLSEVDFLGSILSVFLVAGAYATLALALFTAALRYTNNFYGDGAYTMLTLPCNRGSVLFSKFFVSYIWMLAAEATVILSYFGVRFYAHSTLGTEVVSFIDGLLIFKNFSWTFIAFGVAALLILTAYIIYSIYFSVSFSHMAGFSKNRRTVAAASFLILNAVVLIMAITLMLKVPCSVQMTREGVAFVGSDLTGHIAQKLPLDNAYVGVSGIAFLLIATIVLHCVTKYLIKNKTML